MLNWYNPFAWLIRKSIRRNLEFIADNNVLETGIDKKQYQYLLLKVNGIASYGMANNFNFSSLKKRIIMMNKTKSSAIHLLKFLFILPFVAVLIVAFRGEHKQMPAPAIVVLQDRDTIPAAQPAPSVKPTPSAKPKPPGKPAPPAGKPAPDAVFVMDASLEGPGHPYRMMKDSANPLIVVNGKKYNEPLHTIDPNDIESVNIYKGELAIKEYGEKGKNGVISIITKQHTDQPVISLVYQKLVFTPRQTANGRTLTIKQEFTDSLNKVREEKGLFYIGIYNIVDIKIEKTDPEKVQVQVDNATVIRENGKFNITTKTPGKSVLRVFVTGANEDKKEVYRKDVMVAFLPSPAEKDIISTNN
jgi:hypothetical protein